MLADGYWRGASTLVAGPSGAGKTLVALHFVFCGAELGEQGIYATLQENPIQLERIVQGFSWSLKQPKVELMFRPPVDLYLDEWVYDLLDLIEHTGAKRVAIDSLGDLRAACGDEIRFREYMYSFLQRCVRRNVSVMMTQEVPELFGITRLSEFGISHVSDNVVLLQFLRGDSEVKRAITCSKHAAARTTHGYVSSRSPQPGYRLAISSSRTRVCCSHVRRPRGAERGDSKTTIGRPSSSWRDSSSDSGTDPQQIIHSPIAPFLSAVTTCTR